MKNKKGFSMIEILATIVLIGILSVIAVIFVNYLLRLAEEKYYKTQRDNIIKATMSYVENNKNVLPRVNGQYSQDITLRNLQTSKYIGNVLDYHKEKCNNTETKVKIFKYKDEYHYTAYLSCPNIKDDAFDKYSDITFNVTFNSDRSNPKAYLTYKNSDGIIGYSYKIYRDDVLTYSSDVFDGNEKTTINKTISLKKYLDAVIKVEVSATNINGNSNTKSFSTRNFLDTIRPNCEDVIGAATDSNDWIKGKRKIKVGCSDTGSGCVKEYFTKQFDEDLDTGYVTIKDKNGNKRDCPVKVQIERTVSKPGITGGGSWSRTTTTIKVNKASVAASGIKNYQYCVSNTNSSIRCSWNDLSSSVKQKSFEDEGIYYVFFKAVSKAGNESVPSDPETVKIEKSIGELRITGGGSWKTKTVIRVSKVPTSLSGIARYAYCKVSKNTTTSNGCSWTNLGTTTSKEFTEGGEYNIFFKATSNAGNIAISNYEKVMNEKIVAPEIAGGSTSRRAKARIYITNNPSASSGIKKYQYCKNTNANINGCNWVDMGLNTEKTFEEEGAYWVFFKLVSNAGGEGVSKGEKVIIDDKPTKPSLKGGTDWNNQSRVVWVSNPSTAPSGIKRYEYCQISNTNVGTCTWKSLSENNNGSYIDGLDVAYYLGVNQDLKDLVGGGAEDLANHYYNFGRNETRGMRDPNWIRDAQNISDEGNWNIYFRAISNTDVKSNVSDPVTVKIDKTPPVYKKYETSRGTCFPELPQYNTCTRIYFYDNLSGIKKRDIHWGDYAVYNPRVCCGDSSISVCKNACPSGLNGDAIAMVTDSMWFREELWDYAGNYTKVEINNIDLRPYK